MDNKQHHKELLKRLRKLKLNSDIFGDSFMNSPKPMWYKSYYDGTFKMIIVNRAYTERTGITLSSYYMQQDDKIWNSDISEDFEDNDLQAVRKRVRVPMEETVKNPLSGKTEVWVGFKYPRFDPKTQEVIGVHGQADVWPKEVWDEVPPAIKKTVRLER